MGERDLPKSKTAVYVTGDGTVYRVLQAEVSRLTDTWSESYIVLTVGGGATSAQELPEDAVLVWSPEPTVPEIRRLADQLRGGWHVPSGYWGLAHNLLSGLLAQPVEHRVTSRAGGDVVCACGLTYPSADDWATHYRYMRDYGTPAR